MRRARHVWPHGSMPAGWPLCVGCSSAKSIYAVPKHPDPPDAFLEVVTVERNEPWTSTFIMEAMATQLYSSEQMSARRS